MLYPDSVVVFERIDVKDVILLKNVNFSIKTSNK